MGNLKAYPFEKIRVIHFIDNLGPGGKERQLVELVNGCQKRGNIEMLIISMSEGSFYADLKESRNITIKYLIRRWKKDPFISLKLLSFIKEFKADIFIAWDHMTAVYAVPAVKLMRTPFINMMIQDAPLKLTTKAKFRAAITFPFSDLIVANSKAGLDAYNCYNKKSAVLYNGFDLSRIGELNSKADVRKKYSISEGFVIGMVATFRETKDQKTLIRAIKLISEIYPDIQCIFVGDGGTINSCKKMASKCDKANIIFTGSVNEDLESLINIFDIGVLATYTEGISNSIMEYMVLGKAVVATNGGGTSELVVDGETGFLVPASDPEKLADTLMKLIDDEKLCETMGNNGKRKVEELFNLERLVDDFISMCEKIQNKKMVCN